ncbi:MAG: excinuclease ABC subunit A, partial [Betaproteobacteria bacterium]|nr:excinuclease ABC subunit A [Betaproteobacteria bacterium]
MKQVKAGVAALAIGSIAVFSGVAHAGKTLDAVKQRGQLICGVSTGLPGFSQADSQGNWSGLDVDVCKAVAASVLGDASKVKYVPLTAQQRFAALQASRERSYSAGTFSFNSGNGRCQTCSGSGFEHIEMQFLSDVYLRCPDCDGRRFRAEVLEVKERGKSVADVLAMTVAEALIFYERDPEIRSRLQPLVEVGLEYLSLGQPVPSLSGGEAQRLKLAGFLAQAAADARSPRRRMQAGRRAGTLFLFDEPTTGLHFDDIRKLLKAFRQLLDAGH